MKGLEVKLLIPGNQLPPGERFITAVVNDGVETFRYKFGRTQGLSHIWSQIPRLYADELFDRQLKAKFLKEVA